MMRTGKRPRWWILDALVVAMAGLFVVEYRLHLTAAWHHLALALIALAIFSMAALWARIYRGALLDDDWMHEVATNRRRGIRKGVRASISTDDIVYTVSSSQHPPRP